MALKLSEIRLRNLKHRGPEFNLTAENVRRIDLSGVEFVRHLVDPTCHALFGDIEIDEILCKSFLSLCLLNEDNERIAVISVNDHPNIPAIPPWEWSHWLYNLYRLERINPRNTLWIHLVAWDKRYTEHFLKPLLEALFAYCYYLEQVIFVAPPGIQRIDWLEKHATKIFPDGNYDPRRVQTLFLIVRQHYVTKYKIRRAVEEDNDDLVPLVHAHSERLQELYGEYYVAEMLTRHQDAGRQIIVAEEGGYAVAMLCLNEVVNYEVLNDHFELIPFYGLKKKDERDNIDENELTPQESVTVLHVVDDSEMSRLSTLLTPTFQPTVGKTPSLETFESDEVELEVHSDESEDDFSIVNVSSIHLIVNNDESEEDSLSLETRESQYSAMILSYNEYEMHMYADKGKLKSISYDDLEHHSSRMIRTQQYNPKIPVYMGKENAFTLELAAAEPKHEDALRLLLEAAFECYPDRDYCVLAVTSTAPPFPLLEYFVRVSPRPVSCFPHELYVLHRNAITSYISVRIAVRSDLKSVEELTASLAKGGALLKQFSSAVNEADSTHRAFVLLSEDQPIGVAVIREEEDVEYLKTHYELMHWFDEHRHKPGSHGLLEHFMMSPIFQNHSKFFLRELHRLSDFSALYYIITTTDSVTIQRERTLASVLGDLVAVQPRLKPEFTHTNLEGCGPADVVHRVDAPFALYLSSTRHCSLPCYEINTRIVVVGSSDAAIAFLESLICTSNPYYQVTFTNVSIVAPHGLGYHKLPNHVRDLLFVINSNLTHRHMHLISLRTYVNIVNGVMTAIDRKNKHLIVNDDSFLTYDLLFLMCGEQFQKPISKSTSKNKNEFPENVFIINTETDAANALTKLKILTNENFGKGRYNVIVYGHFLEAYCCVSALLEYGVPGTHLYFVDPFPYDLECHTDHDVSLFNDGEIDEAVQKAVIAEGVTLYNGYYFIEWNYNQDENRIHSVKFESKHKMMDIECIAMFMYYEKAVSTRTFLAINRAGLVFDGRLVIGPDCRTNDPYIYAAGTLTKYSRKYYADHMAPKYFNLYEIGHKLGQQIRNKLIPFHKHEKERPWEIECKTGNMLVPRYVKPLSKYCVLPGGLRYLSVTKPGKTVPLETAMSQEDYGKVFVTGDCKTLDSQGYFRLHLNSYNAVETITCLAKFEIDRINLTSIWGKHEKLLNNLTLRFEMVLVTDLFEYFREPWACAIYHDRYPSLEETANEIMYSLTPCMGDSVIEDLIKNFEENKWNELPYHVRDYIQMKFIDSPYHKLLEQKVLDFLEDNNSYLPMYAHPFIVRMILQGYENSPLFNPQ